jgi:capsular polysaccharide biosynthesis protein
MLSTRKEPENLKAEDLWIFKHELQRNFAEPLIVKLRNTFITADGHFPDKYKSNPAISYHAKFFSFKLYNLLQKIRQLKFTVIWRKRIIITDEWSKSYFHWLMDCLPRLILFESSRSSRPEIPVILPSYLRDKSFVVESLALMGKNNIQFLKKDKWYFLRTLYFPVHLAPTGNYNDEITRKLRSAFTPTSNAAAHLKIYISRGKAAHRKIDNEADILPLLKKNGFKTVFCEEMSFKEQVSLFSETAVLLTNHGAGLTNMLFMPAGSNVIELRKKNDDHNNCYFSLASALNLKYYYQQCEAVHEDEDAYTANLIVEPAELSALLEEVVQAKATGESTF